MLDLSYTVVEGRYFAKDGEERACYLATLWDGSQIVWDAETMDLIEEHDGAYALT